MIAQAKTHDYNEGNSNLRQKFACFHYSVFLESRMRLQQRTCQFIRNGMKEIYNAKKLLTRNKKRELNGKYILTLQLNIQRKT